MKFFIVLLAVVAAVCAEEMASDSMKTKRGLHLSLGSYHSPAVVSHSYVAPAPLIAHSAPLVAAPVYHKTYVAHAPVVHHAPAYAAYHAPAYAAYHAPAYHAPAYVAHAPVYHAYHRR
ncbi:cuticle protein 12.5-like [Ochlerotatus camptorhynchus]|uniref:cuticle protein 12.5-like n=1 Tax=Ochlerotatus camptorhynchus TaxID=644619 RepID=UPI0031D60AA9